MLPSMTFSRPCRSTLNGVCAASGKFGALIGSSVFLPLASWLGNDKVMMLCAAVSIVAAIVTSLFVDDISALESSLGDAKDLQSLSSEAHLACLQEEEKTCPSNMPKSISMPNFLDLE